MLRRKLPRPTLPDPCVKCKPFGGLWAKDAFGGGMERCQCERGRLLAAGLGRKRKAKAAGAAGAPFDGRMAATGES